MNYQAHLESHKKPCPHCQKLLLPEYFDLHINCHIEKCRFCGLEFIGDARSYQSHLDGHRAPCPHCNKLLLPDEFGLHVEAHFTKCSFCKSRFLSEIELDSHLQTHKVVCSHCNAGLLPNEYQEHLKIFFRKCPYCKTDIPSESFKEHKYRNHHDEIIRNSLETVKIYLVEKFGLICYSSNEASLPAESFGHWLIGKKQEFSLFIKIRYTHEGLRINDMQVGQSDEDAIDYDFFKNQVMPGIHEQLYGKKPIGSIDADTGTLTLFGWRHDKDERSRHSAIKASILINGRDKVLGALTLTQKMHEHSSPSTAQAAAADIKWLHGAYPEYDNRNRKVSSYQKIRDEYSKLQRLDARFGELSSSIGNTRFILVQIQI